MDNLRGLLTGLSTNDEFLLESCQKATAWGVSIVPDTTRPVQTRPVRIALTPRSFPATLFNKVVALNPIFNRLVDSIATDVEWLISAHHDVILCDSFTGRLVAMASAVYSGSSAKSVTEDIRLHLLRNDFLPTDSDKRILQVEINTISASFAGLLEALSLIHQSNRAVYYPSFTGVLPVNTPCTAFASAMAAAVAAHNIKWTRSSAYVLFVVEEGERNIVDQYAIEYRLVQQHGLTVLRRTLGQVHTRASILTCGQLSVDGLEVALVYFRSGYDPKHYPSDNEWAARELIERSRAVKCPSLPMQLAGTKKVQQLWYTDNGAVLKRFGLTHPEIKEVQEVFARQADPSVDREYCQAALENPDGWVLKPQREGGGHNLYGDDLKLALASLSHDELSQYVLMERMHPNPLPGMVVDGVATAEAGRIVPVVIDEAVSELGIYSFYMPQLQRNEVCGHLLRTKEISVKEGGVNAGFAVLDTAHLV